MIACTLTTEDIEAIEKDNNLDIKDFDHTDDPDTDLDKAITYLFKNSIALAYVITFSDSDICYRCGLPRGDSPLLSNQGCASGRPDFGPDFDPDAVAPELDAGECRYRVFPNKANELWYGSYENRNPGGTAEDFDKFIKPIEYTPSCVIGGEKNVINMAGSATCLNFWGFLQGAYYSGIGAANASLHELRKTGTYPSDSKLDRNWCADPAPFSIGNPTNASSHNS